MLTNWGATADEIDSAMPGDDLIGEAETSGRVAQGTRSISIDAAPEVVFDFLAQMGFGKAGWYSYDLLDNLGRRSASHIDPSWSVKQAGDQVPGGPLSFEAAVVDRPAAFVLQLPQRRVGAWSIDFTLAYRLRANDGGTRLASRVRTRVDGPGGSLLARLLLAGDGVMVRKQLLGVRERAEAHAG